jgi:4-amino-4-deoxy-L-arabinose transferase-like glycosyltransferase
MKMKLLWFILFVAFALRFYQINVIPPSLSWDEVSIGYNAYSILKTGRDEHGKFLPLDTFVAYGDYKPPLSIYLTVPFVALFGLNELAVRLPSALFGTATVFLTYFLVKQLFRKSPVSGHLSLVSSLLLAISPWHVNLSRAGFEANIALFFIVLGAWLILWARDYPKAWIGAWLPFAAAVYTFNSSRYFAVFLAGALCVYLYPYIKKQRKLFGIGVIVAMLSLMPILPHLVSKESRLRFTEVNIFTDASVVETANQRIEREGNSMLAKLLNNRRVGYARSYLIHFFDNLQPEFLFIKGDGNPKFSIQDVGQMYYIEAPFLIIGIFAMLTAYPQIATLLLFWLLASIIPAATARETPHALRILNSLPTWHVFIAYGIIATVSSIKYQVSSLKTNNLRFLPPALILILVMTYAFSVTYYLHNYYVHYPKEFSAEWQYGYREALRMSDTLSGRYKKVYVTSNIGRPYMYTLFYTKTDPVEFQKSKNDSFDAAGFYHVYSFGKYYFPTLMPARLEKGALYIWDAGAAPKGARIITTIKRLDGSAVLDLFDNGEENL